MSIQEAIRERISESLSPTFLDVVDVSNCNCGYMFNIVVVSECFMGKRSIERQRLVNQSIGTIFNEIHSVSMKCLTPEEYSSSQS
ncbi:putative BolA-like protein [Cryptosporidium felis]|nr:putative BolA-like protein [Cryptosporidium felis]